MKNDLKKQIERMINRNKDYNKAYLLLLQLNDKEFTRRILNIELKNIRHFFRPTQTEDLVLSIQDIEFAKEYVRKYRFSGLDSSTVTDLIYKINDEEFTKECVKNCVIIGFNENIVKNLICGIEDIEFIKYIIDEKERIGLSNYNIVEILENIKNKELTIFYLANYKKHQIPKSGIIRLIKTIDDINIYKYFIQNREKYEINIQDLYEVIEGIKDNNFIINCINNSNELKLNKKDIKDILIVNGDIDLIKRIIEEIRQPEKFRIRNNKGNLEVSKFLKNNIKHRYNQLFGNREIRDLILLTGDIPFIKKCIQNRNELNLSRFDEQVLKEFVTDKKVNLPSNMTVGIEIESEGKGVSEISEMLKVQKSDWVSKKDWSLNKGGIEVVSPILTGNNEKVSNDIKSICAKISGNNQKTTERCGGHIHIGADYLSSTKDWKNFLEIYTNTEKILYIISNQMMNSPRKKAIKYALPLSKKITNADWVLGINFGDAKEREDIIEKIQYVQGFSRSFGINFNNINNRYKNTIEFRLANGTLNPKIWIENINLFGGIVSKSHELTKIQSKDEKSRSEEDNKNLKCLEIIKTSKNEIEVLKALLKLCLNKEDYYSFLMRYAVNKELIEESPIDRKLNKGVTKQKFDISKEER